MYPPGLQWSHNGLVIAKKIGFDLEGLEEKSIHPDSPNGVIMNWCNGVVLAKKFGFDFDDLEKGINPDSPETGIHNEEGLLPRFVLSEILPAILSSSEENEDLKILPKRKIIPSPSSEEEYGPAFSFVKMKKVLS